MESAYNLVEYVGNLVPERRMVRLSSSLFPMATEPNWRYVLKIPQFKIDFSKVSPWWAILLVIVMFASVSILASFAS